MASKRRFRRGDRVMCLHDSNRVIGHILCIEIEKISTCIRDNEWITEFNSYAHVLFGTCSRKLPFKELILSSNIHKYESLQPGDFIIYGKRKNARALVLNVFERKLRKKFVTNVQVTILENGVKKNLSINHDVSIIQRV